MNKLINSLIVLCVCASSIWVYAEYASSKGYSIAENVAEAQSLKDGDEAVLEGVIVRDIGPDRYLLQYDTGQIDIEIKDELIMGTKIDPGTKVRVYGEFEDDWLVPLLEVEYLDIIE